MVFKTTFGQSQRWSLYRDFTVFNVHVRFKWQLLAVYKPLRTDIRTSFLPSFMALLKVPFSLVSEASSLAFHVIGFKSTHPQNQIVSCAASS